MRLLVVEDEPRISELIKAALERAEFVVDTVRVRADAREALANTPYDAAILDLGLPDGDGLELLAELRPAGNHIPILILTARDAVEQRVLGLDAGADDYLVKPFAMQDDELVVSIPERNGAMHDYTFSMQPNDLALGPIRSRCFDF